MKYILFNPKSKNGNNVEIIKDLENIIGEEVESKTSVLDKKNYLNILESLTSDDQVYIVGGDGTLHYFVNDVKG